MSDKLTELIGSDIVTCTKNQLLVRFKLVVEDNNRLKRENEIMKNELERARK